MKHIVLLSGFTFFLYFQLCSQSIIYTDTIGKFEIFVEQENYNTTFFAKYDNIVDTVWNNANGAIPISTINYVNIFDEDKFVIIYTCLSSYYYLILIRDSHGWGESGMVERLLNISPRKFGKVQVIDATTVLIQQNGSITKVSFNLETKSSVRTALTNEKN